MINIVYLLLTDDGMYVYNFTNHTSQHVIQTVGLTKRARSKSYQKLYIKDAQNFFMIL